MKVTQDLNREAVSKSIVRIVDILLDLAPNQACRDAVRNLDRDLNKTYAKDKQEILTRWAGTLWDGMAYSNWPWGFMPKDEE